MKRRQQHPARLLQALSQIWNDFIHTPEFERCPCPTCGGMLSTKENMIRGRSHYFCTQASRDRFEVASEPLEAAYLPKAS